MLISQASLTDEKINLMLLKIFKTKIDVDFIDAETNKIFAKSKMPIEQLPKSFATATTMHIGNENWQVVSATPMTHEEIKKKTTTACFK